MTRPIRMSLRENAYDFLNESLRNVARASEEPEAWKFGVLHVVQGIELLLKARLQSEHQALIYENIDRQRKTVSVALAVQRITGAAQIELEPDEIRSIHRARKWRDEIVHHEFELSPYEVESIYVQLFEFLIRFHDEHTDFGVLHDQIDPQLWDIEANLMEFFKQEFVNYNGMKVIRSWPAEIVAAQDALLVELHGTEFERLPYGVEPGWEMSAHLPCHDCAVVRGQLHVPNCDVEACPRCFGQIISCGCLDDDGPSEATIEPLAMQVARYRQEAAAHEDAPAEPQV